MKQQNALDDIKPLPGRAQTRGGIVRPGSASGPKVLGSNSAFGRSFSNHHDRQNGAKVSSRIQPLGGLNKNALAKFDHINKGKIDEIDDKI